MKEPMKLEITVGQCKVCSTKVMFTEFVMQRSLYQEKIGRSLYSAGQKFRIFNAMNFL